MEPPFPWFLLQWGPRVTVCLSGTLPAVRKHLLTFIEFPVTLVLSGNSHSSVLTALVSGGWVTEWGLSLYILAVAHV